MDLAVVLVSLIVLALILAIGAGFAAARVLMKASESRTPGSESHDH